MIKNYPVLIIWTPDQSLNDCIQKWLEGLFSSENIPFVKKSRCAPLANHLGF